MARWTDADRAAAVTAYVCSGNLAEGQRAIAVEGREPSKNSIRTWAKAAGHDIAEISAQAAEKTKSARQVARQTWEEAKPGLILDLTELARDAARSALDYLADGQPDKARSCMAPMGVSIEKLLLMHGDATSVVRLPWDPEAVKADAHQRGEGLKPHLVASEGEAV